MNFKGRKKSKEDIKCARANQKGDEKNYIYIWYIQV